MTGSQLATLLSDFAGSFLANLFFQQKGGGGEGAAKTAGEFAARVLGKKGKERRDEALFNIVLQSAEPAIEKAITQHFLPQLGPWQRAEFMLTIAQQSLEKGDKGQAAAIEFLTKLARADVDAMIEIATARGYMQLREENYLQAQAVRQVKQKGLALLGMLPTTADLKQLAEQIRASMETGIASLQTTNSQLLELKQRLRRG